MQSNQTSALFNAPTRQRTPFSMRRTADKPVAAEDSRLGDYILALEIGQGGMGTTYLATTHADGETERPVAIKILDPLLADLPAGIEMFHSESALMSRIQHPNLPTVIETGSDGNRHYIVMDYVEGETLAALRDSMRIRRRHPKRLESITSIVIEACDVIQALHESTEIGKPDEMLHRELCPKNLVLGCDGSVRIVDLGIALWSRRDNQAPSRSLKGKLAYVAPEIVAGLKPDVRASVWSLGVILWELLAEQQVYEVRSRSEYSVLGRHLPRPSIIADDVNKTLDEIVARATSIDRCDRYDNVGDFAKALRNALKQEGEPARSAAELAEFFDNYIPDGRVRHNKRMQKALDLGSEQAALDQKQLTLAPATPLPPSPFPPLQKSRPTTSAGKSGAESTQRVASCGSLLPELGLAVALFSALVLTVVILTPFELPAPFETPDAPNAVSIPTEWTNDEAATRLSSMPVPNQVGFDTTGLRQSAPATPIRMQAIAQAPSPDAPSPAAPSPKASPSSSGELIVTSKSPANVYVGGRAIGATPTRVRLPTGRAAIKIVTDDGAVNKAVEVEPGRTHLVSL